MEGHRSKNLSLIHRHQGIDMDGLESLSLEDSDLHDVDDSLEPDWNFYNAHTCSHCCKIVIDIYSDREVDDYLVSPGGFYFDRHADPICTLEQARAAAEGCTFFSWLTALDGVKVLGGENQVVWRYGKVSGGTSVISFGVNDTQGQSVYDGLSAWREEILMMMTGPGKAASPVFVVFTDRCSTDDPSADFLDIRPINTQPAAQHSHAQARAWMQECLEFHESCPKPTGHFMPQRVIEIGRTLRLVETEGDTKPFVALSYCWGGDQIMVTTKENVEEMKREINYNHLPATIQDAVDTTEALGIDYLWVDALCIIQDDPDGKLDEISRMSDIYTEATVTLLASRAADARSGFLGRRKIIPDLDVLWLYPTVRFPFRRPDSVLGTVTLMPIPIMQHQEPLDTRAWTLQERLLSPRVLEYGTNQTRWNCRRSMEQGGHVDGWTEREAYFGRRKGFISIFGPPLAGSRDKRPWKLSWEEEDDYALKNWHDLVDVYTARKMTFAADRLPAISGMMARYDSMIDDECLAGMWKSVLLHELLWSVIEGKLYRRPRPAPAPSWSWASISSAVEFPRLWESIDSDFKVELLSVSVQPLRHDAPFAGVKSGEMVVRGRLRPAIWTPRTGFGWEWDLPLSTERLRLSTEATRDLDSLLIASVDHDAVEDALLQMSSSLDVVLLEVSRFRDFGAKGLMLRQVGDKRFSRLGVFSFEWRDPFLHYDAEDALGVPDGMGKEQFQAKMEEQKSWFDGFEPQVITIV